MTVLQNGLYPFVMCSFWIELSAVILMLFFFSFLLEFIIVLLFETEGIVMHIMTLLIVYVLNSTAAVFSNGKLVHVFLFKSYIFKLFGDCSYPCGSILLALYESFFQQSFLRVKEVGFGCGSISLCDSTNKCYYMGVCWSS